MLISDNSNGEWNTDNALLGAGTRFVINENEDDVEESEYLLDTTEPQDEQLTIDA